MERFTSGIVKRRKLIMIIFITLAVICGIMAGGVLINYNLEDYLPKDSNSTEGMSLMEKEFDEDFPTASVMVRNVSVHQALEYKENLENISGVTAVTWLDDVIGQDVLASTPLEFLDSSVIEAYYKNGNALFSVSIAPGFEVEAVDGIYEVIGEENAASGSSVSKAVVQKLSATETLRSLLILVPLIIIVLLLTTSSYIEPLLYLAALGVAILINMGTNLLFDDISFITYTVSPILQMAVSLDYAIFLMHSFKEYRERYEPEEAMKRAIKKSFTAVAASAATTVIGFLALIFMRFGIGADLGINLVKGVVLSFISVMIFLPALALSFVRIMDKTQHKTVRMDLKRVGQWLMKLRIPLLIISILVIIPCFLAKDKITFEYGSGAGIKASRAEEDKLAIEEQFGKINQMAILVPKGGNGSLNMLSNQLEEIEGISAVISYASYIGPAIPEGFVEGQDSMFNSENYSRIILYTDYEIESEETFAAIEKIRATAEQYFEEVYLVGESASVYDIKDSITADNTLVTLIAILGIFLVILISFKSLSLPFLLVFAIEAAIWINLSFTYFQGGSLNYIGYLVINTVQLGATIDYAILITDRYMHNRTLLAAKEAISKTLANNIVAVMISAGILASAGFALTLTSSNPIVIELGNLLARGTILSFVMVSTVLPALLILFDKVIRKTTYKNGFHLSKKTGGDIK